MVVGRDLARSRVHKSTLLWIWYRAAPEPSRRVEPSVLRIRVLDAGLVADVVQEKIERANGDPPFMTGEEENGWA